MPISLPLPSPRALQDIPANMQQDVTAAVTFFTVLILVNEKSLNMSGEEVALSCIARASPSTAGLTQLSGWSGLDAGASRLPKQLLASTAQFSQLGSDLSDRLVRTFSHGL